MTLLSGDRFGSVPPALVASWSAVLVVLVALGGAWLVGRFAGPHLTTLWSRVVGSRIEGMAQRMCAITRYAVVSVMLAIAIKAQNWPDIPKIIIGVPLSVAVALLVASIIRGLHLPHWAAGGLAAVAFIATLADVLDGLTAISGLLDQVGITVGDTRLSLLSLTRFTVAVLILFAVFRLASRIIDQSISRTTRFDPTQRLLAQKLSGVALLAAALLIGVDIIGIDLTALAVFSGAFGLAIGFGFQKTFGNLIAGIILLMDRSIKPGDVIAVGESFGHVTKIGVRAVSIVTRDGKEHLIPNENLMTQEVENWSYSTTDVRIHIPVGVAYDCDLPRAQQLMIEAASVPSRVLKSPAPKVWLREFGESSVDHDILVWIRDPEAGVGNVQSEILNRLWVLFKENGISIPYPQRDLHIKELPGQK